MLQPRARSADGTPSDSLSQSTAARHPSSPTRREVIPLRVSFPHSAPCGRLPSTVAVGTRSPLCPPPNPRPPVAGESPRWVSCVDAAGWRRRRPPPSLSPPCSPRLPASPHSLPSAAHGGGGWVDAIAGSRPPSSARSLPPTRAPPLHVPPVFLPVERQPCLEGKHLTPAALHFPPPRPARALPASIHRSHAVGLAWPRGWNHALRESGLQG